jgi:hypothetical protein
MHWPAAGWLYNVSVWSAGRLETSRRPVMIGGGEAERPMAATAARSNGNNGVEDAYNGS